MPLTQRNVNVFWLIINIILFVLGECFNVNSQMSLQHNKFLFVFIGGHGFRDKGGVCTGGVSKKNFVAASDGGNTGV